MAGAAYGAAWGLVFCLSACTSTEVKPWVYGAYLPKLEESGAYAQYALKSKGDELHKLYYVVDRLGQKTFVVRYNGSDFESAWIMAQARAYVEQHYHGGSAETFIRSNRYVQGTWDHPTYFRTAGGDVFLLMDVLLEELHSLERFERSRPGYAATPNRSTAL